MKSYRSCKLLRRNVSETFHILCDAGTVFSIQKQKRNTLLMYIIYKNILNSIYAREIFIFINMNMILYTYC